jgi:DNA mismatch repair protein MutL
VSEAEETELSSRLSDLAALGIQITDIGGRKYEISALPADLLAVEEAELVEALKQPNTSIQQLVEKICSLAACRAAVKDGEVIDAVTAAEIIRQSLNRENPRCPHGRPIWHRVTREELFRHVLRL